MKKLILSLSLLIFLGIAAQAQTDFLIRGGLHSVINPESKINTTSIKGGKVGWNLGADLRFGNYLFIQPGVHYYVSSLSQEASDPSIDGFRNSLRLQSLKVPVVVGLSPFNLNRSDFAILVSAGIVPTFNLGIRDNKDFIKNDDITNVNWSGKVGAGLEFGAFIVGVDYEFGLNKIFEDADKKFSIVGATVGFKF